MRTLSLRMRIAALFLALLALVQVATLVLVNAASYDAARARISAIMLAISAAFRPSRPGR